ncbi:uncharacterized protein G2W53_022595 [Senna tora]|uniref:Uncharacterized protein n=1 Tax=Senna tora TaxID=362788 RepID=A0A834WM93_9FABA|nr:uncharacterized protein G2W53_022595 [Senna tora]
MASLIRASDSPLASSNLASNLAPINSLGEIDGKPTWMRKALNFGCSKLKKKTEPQDSELPTELRRTIIASWEAWKEEVGPAVGGATEEEEVRLRWL